jgi:hypothetical protein
LYLVYHLAFRQVQTLGFPPVPQFLGSCALCVSCGPPRMRSASSRTPRFLFRSQPAKMHCFK